MFKRKGGCCSKFQTEHYRCQRRKLREGDCKRKAWYCAVISDIVSLRRVRAEHTLSSNDQRHRFVLSGTFDLPFGDEEESKKAPGVIAKLFGKIEAAPILIVGTGRPINPLTGFDANRSGAFPLSSRPLGFNRNSLITPSQVQFDLRVLKFFKIGEHGKLDFVAESFNVLNHTNVLALNQFYGPDDLPIPVFTTPNKAGIPRQLQFSIDFEF
jgi:hypothetical protein